MKILEKIDYLADKFDFKIDSLLINCLSSVPEIMLYSDSLEL